MNHKKPAALIILDGLGYAQDSKCNALTQAYMPTFNMLLNTYPTTLLDASGHAVGLPKGAPGNSEVGHLTLGAGEIIQQPLTIIDNAIKDGSFFKNTTLLQALEKLKKNKRNLHIMGLISYGAVHSSLAHLYAFIQAAENSGIEKIFIHGFLDGRDIPPKTAATYIKDIEDFCKKHTKVKLASLQGRFYAMDRNQNWQLTEESYQVLTTKKTPSAVEQALEENYKQTGSEEFLPPLQLPEFEPIQKGDGVIFFNFRPDRARQLTNLFLQKNRSGYLDLSFFITPFSYGPQYPTTILFEKHLPKKTINDILHDTLGYSLFSIAETEKYAHVTYFFNGGKEKKRDHETRVLIPSITRKEYSQHPEMNAPLITQAVIESLQHNPSDFYIINYANADMVGHTGNFKATVAALECLDTQLAQLIDAFVTQHDGILFITADHGNAEELCHPITGQLLTSHTNNPVYFTVVAQELRYKNKELELHKLSDVAPFILTTLQDR